MCYLSRIFKIPCHTFLFFFLTFIGFDKCIISGDPHYRTFDKFNHHYQGAYTYVLTKDNNLPSFLTPLTVRGKNVRRGGNNRISFLHEVYVDVYGFNIRLQQKRVLLVRKCIIYVKRGMHVVKLSI